TGAAVYHIGSHAATFEAGAKYRHVRKFSDTYSVKYAPHADIFLSSFPNQLTNDRYYNGGKYPLGYNGSYEDVIKYAIANPGAFTTTSTQGRDASDFTLTENVGAAYAMNTVNLSGRATLITGLRVETTRDNVSNFSIGKQACAPPQSGTCTSINPNAFSGSYVTLLPSVSLTYGLGSSDTL